MPVLSNIKHERFAQELARGTRQHIAYTKAGYAPSPAAASRLAQDPKVADRVEELKIEINRQINKTMSDPENVDGYETLAEMGLTLLWCGNAFKNVYRKAIETNQLGAANQAVQNIQKLVEIENGGRPEGDEEEKDERLSIRSTIALMQEMNKAHTLRALEDEPEPKMIDVSPDKGDKVPVQSLDDVLDTFLDENK